MERENTLHYALFTWLEDYPYLNITSPFTVKMSTAKIVCTPPKTYTYMYDADPLSFGILYYNETIAQGMKLTTVLQPVAIDDNGDVIRLPNFVSFAQASGLFTVKDIDADDLGEYTIGL